jgi:hypothetical protein
MTTHTETEILNGDAYPETEAQMRYLLGEALIEFDGNLDPYAVQSFEDVGLMTMNDGVVIRFPNGAEFQLTIVKSKDADEPASECVICPPGQCPGADCVGWQGDDAEGTE